MNDKVKVHIGTLEEMGQRFIEAWHRAERGDAVDERPITFHDLKAKPVGTKTGKRRCEDVIRKGRTKR